MGEKLVLSQEYELGGQEVKRNPARSRVIGIKHLDLGHTGLGRRSRFW
jgi:hypothetical protein